MTVKTIATAIVNHPIYKLYIARMPKVIPTNSTKVIYHNEKIG
jgi:hypothetical protein